ncbi:MAG: hypothetical protein Ct9H300mP12_08520 [Acidimicrobiales bacterium]|nr:MAG: hypothetical protein Ct9H300mP12_08520 [Acidimicrobiales bacterium]
MNAPVGLCEADLAERVVEDPRLAWCLALRAPSKIGSSV